MSLIEQEIKVLDEALKSIREVKRDLMIISRAYDKMLKKPSP
jgi:hypothetical protein